MSSLVNTAEEDVSATACLQDLDGRGKLYPQITTPIFGGCWSWTQSRPPSANTAIMGHSLSYLLFFVFSEKTSKNIYSAEQVVS